MNTLSQTGMSDLSCNFLSLRIISSFQGKKSTLKTFSLRLHCLFPVRGDQNGEIVSFLRAISIPSHYSFDFRRICIASLVGFVMFHLLTYPWSFITGSVEKYSEEGMTLGLIQQIELGFQSISFIYRTLLIPSLQDVPRKNFTGVKRLPPPTCGSTLLPMSSQWGFFGHKATSVWQHYSLRFQAQEHSRISRVYTTLLGQLRDLRVPLLLGRKVLLFRVTSASSQVYTLDGPRLVWILEIIVISFTISLWVIFYPRMVPLTAGNKDATPARKDKLESSG